MSPNSSSRESWLGTLVPNSYFHQPTKYDVQKELLMPLEDHMSAAGEAHNSSPKKPG